MGLSTDKAAANILALAVPLAAVAYFMVVWNKSSTKKAKSLQLPSAETGMLENIRKLSGPECPFWMLETARKMGQYSYRINLPLPGGTYIVGDYDLVLKILNDATTDKPAGVYAVFSKITGGLPNIFTATNGAYWKLVRKSTAHAFSKNEVGRMISIADVNAKQWMLELDQLIANGQSFDPSHAMPKLTFDVICSAAFEFTPSLEDCEAFVSSLEICLREFSFRQSTNPLRAMFGIFIPGVRKAHREANKVQAFAWRVLEAYRSNPNKSTNKTLIRLIVENPNFPSDEHRIGEIITFLIAGQDTTGYTLSTTLTLMAKYPEIAKKLRNELAKVDPKDWANVEYYRQVMKESMRLIPVAVTGSIRITGRDFEHNGQMIPKGANIFLPQFLPFRNGKVFQDPDEFKPERWANPTEAMKESMIPFSAGNRNCVGQALAKAEIDAVIPLLMTNFDFEIEEAGSPDYFLTLKIAGAKLKAKRVSA